MIARARAVAAEPYRRPIMKMTEPFADLKYDQFRGIRFRDDKRLFTDDGRGFHLILMPPGFYFQDKIEVNLVAGEVAQPIAFTTDFFAFHPDYFPYPDGKAPAGLAADMGFSGIRFRHPINRPGVFDEVAVFQARATSAPWRTIPSTVSPPAASPSAQPAPTVRSSRSSPPSGSTSRNPATTCCTSARCSTATRSPAPTTSP